MTGPTETGPATTGEATTGPMTTEPRVADVVHDGLRLRVLEWGPADGPVVVILHGFTGHARQAEWTARVLADRYRVVAADLVAVLDHLGVERAALVGHSLGGMVGMSAVARHPERFTHLVLGDIGPEPAPAGVARIQASVASRDDFTDLDDAVAAQTALNPTADPAALRHRVAHNLAPRADGRLTWKYDPALRDGTARYDNHPPDTLWALLAAVPVPVLLLRGEVSDICSAEIAERMRAANPRLTVLVLPGAGHGIATDAPDAVAAAIDAFLA